MFSNHRSNVSATVSPAGWPFAAHTQEPPSIQGSNGSFFFPGQFAARAALVCLADMAKAIGVPTNPVQLARQQGVDLSARLGVQDLVNVAESLGLTALLERHPPTALAQLELPVMVFLADGSHGLQLVTQCDGKYVLMHNHASLVPTHSMVPLVKLADLWALGGQGWVLRLQR